MPQNLGKMRKCNLILVLLINLGSLLSSIACPTCPHPTLLQPQKWIKKPKLPQLHLPHPKLPQPKLPHIPFSPKKQPPKVVKPPLQPNPSPKVPVPLPPRVITKPSPPPPPSSHHLPIRPIINLPPPQQPSSPPPPAPQTCHVDPFKLGACVDLLGGFVHLRIGKKVKETCCPLLEVLVDIEAAFCLCSAMKKKFGKASLVVPIALEVLASCDKSLPSGFHCMA